MIDAKGLEQYRDDGFVVCRQFLSSGEVNQLHENIARYIRDVIPQMPSDEVFYEDRQQPESLKQIQQMWQHDHYFHSLMTEGNFLRVAEQLLDGSFRGLMVDGYKLTEVIRNFLTHWGKEDEAEEKAA